MSRQLVLRALSTLCAAGAASSALGCSGDDPVPACSLSHGFGTTSLTAGMEVDGICMSWVLDNDTELWVNTVAMENDGFFHHSNWFFVPEDEYDFGEDHWSCFENGFSELDAALKGSDGSP